MKLSVGQKVSVLLKLVEENRRQIQWFRNLDFRVAYYMILSIGASVAWMVTADKNVLLIKTFNVFLFFLYVISMMMILRNHQRHVVLDIEFKSMLNALGLFTKGEYGKEQVLSSARPKFIVVAGRTVYVMLLTLIAGLAFLLVNYYIISK